MADNDITEQKVDEKAVQATDTQNVKVAKRRKKAKRSVPSGQVHIMASFNNTIITFTDTKGNVLTSSSAGANGFRGSKKRHSLCFSGSR